MLCLTLCGKWQSKPPQDGPALHLEGEGKEGGRAVAGVGLEEVREHEDRRSWAGEGHLWGRDEEAGYCV